MLNDLEHDSIAELIDSIESMSCESTGSCGAAAVFDVKVRDARLPTIDSMQLNVYPNNRVQAEFFDSELVSVAVSHVIDFVVATTKELVVKLLQQLLDDLVENLLRKI